MSNVQQLLSDYQRYRETCGKLLGGWQPVNAAAVIVSRNSQTMTAVELQQALIALGQVQGWILLTDQRVHLNNQQVTPNDTLILSAELSQQGKSIRLRQLEGDSWLLVETAIKPVDAGQEGTHIATTVQHLSVEQTLGQLEYQQLWCRNEQGRLHIEDAVFTGFIGD